MYLQFKCLSRIFEYNKLKHKTQRYCLPLKDLQTAFPFPKHGLSPPLQKNTLLEYLRIEYEKMKVIYLLQGERD
jgi:hypothetical protein